MKTIKNGLKPDLVIASGNPGKIREFKELLTSISLNIVGQPSDLFVQETGKTFAENAFLKAHAAAFSTGLISLADDSGLNVESLGGAPGIHSARYGRNDGERISRLLYELAPFKNRRAFFSAALCLVSPEGEILLEVEGKCEGKILHSPRGELGFGYDPIFEVKGTELTFAEMGIEKKRNFSHRGRAFEKLIPGLEKIFFS